MRAMALVFLTLILRISAGVKQAGLPMFIQVYWQYFPSIFKIQKYEGSKRTN